LLLIFRQLRAWMTNMLIFVFVFLQEESDDDADDAEDEDVSALTENQR
jgi:hypothetical protein